MNRTTQFGGPAVSLGSGYWRRTPESPLWIWLVMFGFGLLFALMAPVSFSFSAFGFGTLSSLTALVVTHAGLRDAHILAQRRVPVYQVRQRLHDMRCGWVVTGLLLCLSALMGCWLSWGPSLASPKDVLGPWFLLALVCHTACVCAVHAWWGAVHPAHLLVPVLCAVVTFFGVGAVLNVWQQAPVGLGLLACAYGLGAGAWMFRQALTSGTSCEPRRALPRQQLDGWLRHWLAKAGFIEQGDLSARPWSGVLGVGIAFALIPTHQMGSYHLLEPWGSVLTYYEPWRFGFLCLFLQPLLRASQWHWRYVLSPGGPARRNFGLNLITSTLWFVALWFWPLWGLIYAVQQFYVMSPSAWQILIALAGYLPVVAVDFWVAIALVTCIQGRMRPLARMMFFCALMLLPVVFKFGVETSPDGQWLRHLGQRQGVYLIVMLGVGMGLTLWAQHIWRKKDLVQVWHEYEGKSVSFQN